MLSGRDLEFKTGCKGVQGRALWPVGSNGQPVKPGTARDWAGLGKASGRRTRVGLGWAGKMFEGYGLGGHGQPFFTGHNL